MDTIIERVMLLQSTELFAGVPTEQLSHLAGIAKPIKRDKNEVIFEEDDESDALYVLVSGEVKMMKGDSVIYTTKPNQTVGALGFFDQHPRLFKAVCAKDCELLEIDAIRFFDLLEQRSRVAQYLLKFFVKQLRTVYDDDEQLESLVIKPQ